MRIFFITLFKATIMKRQPFFMLALLSLILAGCTHFVAPPKPYGPLPSGRQLNWQELGIICIVHFGLNTFTDQEWGYGDVDPRVFNPSDFDPDQIVLAAKSAGINGLILVAKHHDGFCLWPTRTTDYNISQTPWKNGKGDMVKAFQEACKQNGVQLGIYCSPWDRNNKYYGTQKYIQIYRQQLKELYSNYGSLYEVWFDGANGGNGYYGGVNETRKINKAAYYKWDSTWQIVRSMQPQAVIFSDAGWDVRWVGNERGYAADTTWETFTPQGMGGTHPAPGNVQYAYSPIGTKNGKFWIPAECDVPLRPGWFYHADQEGKQKTPKELFDIYIHSVGRGGNMNLGLAPDTTGRLSKNDVQTLKQFGNLVQETFKTNLAKEAVFKASNIRDNDKKDYGAIKLIDDDPYSYWATDDSVHTPYLIIELPQPKRFNIIQFGENIKLGQRITSVAIDQWKNGDWEQMATATGIGANRLIQLPQFVTTQKVRIRVTQSPVCIALSQFGLYAEGGK